MLQPPCPLEPQQPGLLLLRGQDGRDEDKNITLPSLERKNHSHESGVPMRPRSQNLNTIVRGGCARRRRVAAVYNQDALNGPD